MYPNQAFKFRIAFQQIINFVLPFSSHENNTQYNQTNKQKNQPPNQILSDVVFTQVTIAFVTFEGHKYPWCHSVTKKQSRERDNYCLT